MTPAILMVAPNGARRMPGDHPALPLTPAALAREAVACRAAGAALLHLHVRDRDGQHTLDADAYRAAIGAIHDAVGDGLVVQMTTEAVGRYRPSEQRAAVVAVAPEAVSLAVRELFQPPLDEASTRAFLHALEDRGTLVQYIVYGRTDLDRLYSLVDAGTVPAGRLSILVVVGRAAADEAAVAALPATVAAIRPGDRWACCGFGPLEPRVVLAALALGGDARVGFENNLHRIDGGLATDNSAQVLQAATWVRMLGRPLADAAQARDLWRAG